jgi:CubicO group peptidase (beta-lactamase class C family)
MEYGKLIRDAWGDHLAAAGPLDAVARPRRGRIEVIVARVLATGFASLAALLLLAPLATENSYWARIVSWRNAGFHDFEAKFPSRSVANAAPMFPLRAAPADVPPAFATIDTDLGTSIPLDEFLDHSGSTAFVVLRDDQLLVERYANGSSHAAIQTSFSVAKSFASTLVGIAIGEGLIGSVDDPIVHYLPELKGRGLEGVKIRHLLSMTSGLRYDGSGQGGMPWQDDARTYYDPDLRRLALTVQPAVEPGARWQYNNYHPLLIGLILERATGRSVSAYLSEKLWQPLGMEAPGSWSLDSRHDAFEKMESGLNGRAVDFARFGRLFLRGGVWQEQALVPRTWVATATRPLPDSPVQHYGYLWWIDSARPGRFFAAGNFGQFIYVAPDRDAVVLRFGERYGGIDSQTWVGILRGMADATTGTTPT